MKKIFNQTTILFTALILCALTMSAFAHGHDEHKQKGKSAKTTKVSNKFMGKGDGVETCPVTGEAITNKDISGQFFGRTVYFCCPGCLQQAQKNPAAFVKKTHQAQLVALKSMPKSEGHDHHAMSKDHAQKEGEKSAAKFMGKGDGIETCPVTGEPVNKNIKAELMGRTVYVCCEDCLATVKKNPELYLKPIEAKTEAKFLGKGDGVETCPVTGEPVNKNISAEIMGRTVYFCCAGCDATVKKNPELYLKWAAKQ